jgi:hypothetical protein
LQFGLKVLCFAGLFPYEKICNTPRTLKRYHAYQFTLYVLYCPILFSQIVKFCTTSEDLQKAIDTFTHIVLIFGPYFIPPFINRNELYTLIYKIDMSMQNKLSTQYERNTIEVLRETQQNFRFMSLYLTILGTGGKFCILYDIFISNFVEIVVGVKHKYKRDPNSANV